MNSQIIIPLKRHDQLNDLFRYLKDIASPGTKIVFLVRSSKHNWQWLYAYVTAMETGSFAAMRIRRALESEDRGMERLRAETRLAQISELLQHKGVEVEVRMYDVSLKKVLPKVVEATDVRFVMMPGYRSLKLFVIHNLIARIVKWPRISTAAPVLLFQPASIIGRAE